MENALVVSDIKARLPMPQGMQAEDVAKWRVLCESVFPSAKTPEAIIMALDYCRARKLDPLKKPVHIVPMWSAALNREVETVWPSITEVQITATRTGKYAGMDEPKFGPMLKAEFKGVMRNNVGETVRTVEYPEWCSVTVYRIVEGVRCPFTEPVFWREAYSRVGKTDLPNDQWFKRPHGMILKVAKAFSLRAAFPEEGTYTAEEMEGRVLEDHDAPGVTIDNKPLKVGSPFKTAALRNLYSKNVCDSLSSCNSLAGLNEIIGLNKEKLDAMRESTNEADEMIVEGINNHYRMCREELLAQRGGERDDIAAAFGQGFADVHGSIAVPSDEELASSRQMPQPDPIPAPVNEAIQTPVPPPQPSAFEAVQRAQEAHKESFVSATGKPMFKRV